MKRTMIIMMMVFLGASASFGKLGKIEIKKISLVDKNSCSYYLLPQSAVSYETKAKGLKKFSGDLECLMSISRSMLLIDNYSTQIYLNNLFNDMENYNPDKINVAKAMGQVRKFELPMMIESLLAVYQQDFHINELEIKDYTVHKDNIENYFKLRKVVSVIIMQFADREPVFMKRYMEDMEAGLKHPEYLDTEGDTVLDATIYNNETELYLNTAIGIVNKKPLLGL